MNKSVENVNLKYNLIKARILVTDVTRAVGTRNFIVVNIAERE